jgi:hypothetical protein
LFFGRSGDRVEANNIYEIFFSFLFMKKRINFEDLVVLYPFVTKLGVDENLGSLANGEKLEYIDIVYCSHDKKYYLEDGAHSCYIYYNHKDIKSVEAEIYLCIEQNLMYWYSDDACYIRELHNSERYSINDFKFEEPYLN